MNYSKLKKTELIELVKELSSVKKTINAPEDIIEALEPYKFAEKEMFIVCTLDSANQLIQTKVVTDGLLNRSLVHPREVFRVAIKDNAAAVIVAHNHPSGSLEPSSEDKEITQRLIKASEIIGIAVLDHIIVSKIGSVSMRELGHM